MVLSVSGWVESTVARTVANPRRWLPAPTDRTGVFTQENRDQSGAIGWSAPDSRGGAPDVPVSGPQFERHAASVTHSGLAAMHS
jgi:hypothetical protein